MPSPVRSSGAVRSRAAKHQGPARIINGWQVEAYDDEFKRYTSIDDYLADLEEIVAQHPRYRDGLHANDRLLSFGLHYRWFWKSEGWSRKYPFRECIERAVASLADLRRREGGAISAEEAHLFELFDQPGPLR
jgi:hypothetical protein